MSGHSLPSYIHNQWNGIPYLEAILRWEKEGGKSLIKELQRIQKQILATNMPHLILSCAATQYEEMKKQHFYGVHKKIAPSASSPWKGNFSLPPAESQVRFISAPVAFTAYGMHTIAYRNAEAPYLYLATELLENCILHKEIREKGGAYGGGASYSPSSGNFHLYAYRDPHLANTEKIFRQAIERIAEGKFNESELLEAKFGVLQTLDAPVSPGNRAIVAYAWQRAGRTLPLRGEFRKKILEAEKKQIAQAVAKHLLPQHGVLVSFLGKELFEKEKKKITTSLPVHPIAI
ncbi:MAG: insulinase family protein [Chlamydiia bacterium]|nr:insulinase family protein [Chlamydiia bacterium]